MNSENIILTEGGKAMKEHFHKPLMVGSGCRTKKELRNKIKEDNKTRNDKKAKNEERLIIDPIKCVCGAKIKHGKTNPDLIVTCPVCSKEWYVGV